ncbi:MAG: T6SS effector amidase Tae4 family protein [Akkermansia sp.]
MKIKPTIYMIQIDEQWLPLRHTFTKSDDQPAMNKMPAEAMTKTYEGFVKVPSTGVHTFKIGVDDNGWLEIHGHKIEVKGMGPQNGGGFRYSEPLKLKIPAGHHKIKIYFENIDYKPAEGNRARLEVLMDGAQIILGNITDKPNLWSQANAQKLLGCYTPVDFSPSHTPEYVFDYVGGELKKLHDSGDKDYENSCALRVSIALWAYGITLQKGSFGAEKYDNVSHLGPNGIAILEANNMTSFMQNQLGHEADCIQPEKLTPAEENDSVILEKVDFSNDLSYLFMGGVTEISGHAHVGIATGTGYTLGNGMTNKVWILYCAKWQ